MTAPKGRRGRRPGSPDTRAAIISSARQLFAERGLDGTSLRAVAADAGVDASLVHHYFDSKEDLFVAALELPRDPRQEISRAVGAELSGAGERFLTTFLDLWDDPEAQPALIATARSVLAGGGQLVTDGVLPVIAFPIARGLGVDRADHRMKLVATQLVGIILFRYVLRVEPLASMSREDLVATYAPTVQRYLEAELP